MDTGTETYKVNPREAVRVDLLIPREAKRLLGVLSAADGRTVSDYIREGISIVLVGYSHKIREWEQTHPATQPTIPQEGVQQP